MGGYDIFHAEKLADGSWARPINLGYPINTTDDDLFFVPAGNGKYGYQAIFDEENIGSRDIYRFQMFENEEEYLAALAAMEAPEEEPLAEEPPEEPLEEPVEEPIAVPPVSPDEPSVMYVIRPVFFGFDRYDLTAESKATLNDLVDILELFPMLELQAVGHTDHKGPGNYNLMLSKKRSASVVEYITRKGIDGKRIKSVGKGEDFPVAINTHPDGSDSPEGRALNRRVEILVLKPELPNVQVEEVQVPEPLRK
jgi:outer membrane protein OmpA-like peptidoglycan-associated protein